MPSTDELVIDATEQLAELEITPIDLPELVIDATAQLVELTIPKIKDY